MTSGEPIHTETLDFYDEEADWFVRMDANMANMIHHYRETVNELLGRNPDRASVRRLITMLEKTDFKGYYRDKEERNRK